MILGLLRGKGKVGTWIPRNEMASPLKLSRKLNPPVGLTNNSKTVNDLLIILERKNGTADYGFFIGNGFFLYYGIG